MKYCSTRGCEKDLSFQEVLFAGYAKDGGLYMPDSLPKVSEQELLEWRNYTYPELVFCVLRKFIDEEEISNADLKDITTTSFKRFNIPEIVRIEHLKNGLNIVELFHGATLAFKDLALSIVAGLLNYFLKKNGKQIIILVGTSGDTGSAAIESVRDMDCIDIVVLFPKGRCTKIQELQMTTAIEDNIHVFCVDGTSDDLDEPIKKCFAEPNLVEKYNLISINSINWGRILAQIPHFFYTYYQVTSSSINSSLEIVVPTGAAGHITAGCLAHKLGLPITLVAGVNVNDIVARTLKMGDFSPTSTVFSSLAPSMDIQVPYNVERLLYIFTYLDAFKVAKLMTEFEKNGQIKIPDDILARINQIIIGSFVVDDEKITEVMAKVYREYNYLLCPHSAIAVAYHFESCNNGDVPRAYIATASPAKFPEAVVKAGAPEMTDGVAHLQSLPTKNKWMNKGQDWHLMLKEEIKIISKKSFVPN